MLLSAVILPLVLCGAYVYMLQTFARHYLAKSSQAAHLQPHGCVASKHCSQCCVKYLPPNVTGQVRAVAVWLNSFSCAVTWHCVMRCHMLPWHCVTVLRDVLVKQGMCCVQEDPFSTVQWAGPLCTTIMYFAFIFAGTRWVSTPSACVYCEGILPWCHEFPCKTQPQPQPHLEFVPPVCVPTSPHACQVHR